MGANLMSTEAGVARPASTILLLRDSRGTDPDDEGRGPDDKRRGPDDKRRGAIEVFMMVRHYEIDFASGALVFPGGSVDAGDQEIIAKPELYAVSDGLATATP